MKKYDRLAYAKSSKLCRQGNAGFDLIELPWKKDKFAIKRIFCSPNKDMVEQIASDDIDEQNTWEWLNDIEEGYDTFNWVLSEYPKCSNPHSSSKQYVRRFG